MGQRKRFEKAALAAEILSRLGIGGMFVWAALSKIGDPALFAEQVAHYDMLPGWSFGAFALFVPALELVAGAALALSPFVREAAALISVMLAAFVVALAQALLRGLDISCGCFGDDAGDGGTGGALARDALLLVPTLWLVFRGRCVAIWRVFTTEDGRNKEKNP